MNKKYTIKDAQKLAQKKGGRCLSKKYFSIQNHLLWRCNKGHEWSTSFGNVRYRNSWCQLCAMQKEGKKKSFPYAILKKDIEKRAGQLLTPEKDYKTIRSNLTICCDKGHIWTTRAYNIRKKYWCPTCSGNQRYTQEDARNLVESKGGKILSGRVINTDSLLTLQCEKGHTWKTRLEFIIRGHWCHVCKIPPRLSLKYFHDYARKRHGKCLSKTMKNGQDKLAFRCAKGHIWKAAAVQVKNNQSWCRACLGTARLTLEDMQNLARKNNGKCLSESYKNMNKKLLWECENGHQWEATPNHIKHRSQWCPYCARLKKSRKKNRAGYELYDFSELVVIAKKFSGRCLSLKEKYRHEDMITWCCKNKHIFKLQLNKVIQDKKWCPKCAR